MLLDSICVHVELYLRQSTYSRISTQIDTPLSVWASETFDGKLLPNG